ncbi:uncharacterized protein LOC129170653 isoform X1 [Dunckerocampus dactyliophorus]|uniref:uncharacterized protein LOC129170653 isoform X1 n=1 Tax=Dunckerocampus dactyliophorus TaxID=161453 RepID=UPI002404B288|nr:uncharacterized protein LOC129170653 isoform X1 [Dunckerocampus dactyliophorus]
MQPGGPWSWSVELLTSIGPVMALITHPIPPVTGQDMFKSSRHPAAPIRENTCPRPTLFLAVGTRLRYVETTGMCVHVWPRHHLLPLRVWARCHLLLLVRPRTSGLQLLYRLRGPGHASLLHVLHPLYGHPSCSPASVAHDLTHLQSFDGQASNGILFPLAPPLMLSWWSPTGRPPAPLCMHSLPTPRVVLPVPRGSPSQLAPEGVPPVTAHRSAHHRSLFDFGLFRTSRNHP